VHQENLTLWFTESASPYDSRSVSVKSCLCMGRTALQEVTILDTHDGLDHGVGHPSGGWA
jgi:hypothetical protein